MLPLDPEVPVPPVEEPLDEPLFEGSMLDPLLPVPDDPDDPLEPVLLPLLPEDPLDPVWPYAAPAPASASAPARTIVYLSFIAPSLVLPLPHLARGVRTA